MAPIFFTQSFLPKIFWAKIYGPTIFCPNIFCSKKLFGPKFYETYRILYQIVFWTNFFSIKSFFTKFLLTQVFLGSKTFGHGFFDLTIILEPKELNKTKVSSVQLGKALDLPWKTTFCGYLRELWTFLDKQHATFYVQNFGVFFLKLSYKKKRDGHT